MATRRPEPIIFVDDPDYPANPAQAPEPHYAVGGIPATVLPAAATATAGVVKKAATVAHATVATDGTSAGTQLNLLLDSLRAAGIIS